MLSNLHVKNIALIEDVDVEFSPGLNILTGETGAGKSIILGSVNLAMGKKMTSDSIGHFSESALVELIFEIENAQLLQALKERDIIPEENQVILTRKLMEGRSICRINGETCTIAQMKEAAMLLLDIHGQHEHQTLLSAEKQLAILDEFGGEKIAGEKAKVCEAFLAYKDLEKQLTGYNLDKEQRVREISFLEFEIDEIEKAQLKPEEDLVLEKKYRMISNSRKITEALQNVHSLTGYDSKEQAGELIGSAIRAMSNVLGYEDNLDNLHSTLLDLESMLNDFNRDLSVCLSEMTYSEEEFQQLDERLDFINNIKSKYGSTIEAVLAYQMQQQQKLIQLENFEEEKRKLEQLYKVKAEQLEQLCRQLSKERQKAAVNFQEQLIASLKELNFADVDFEILFKIQYNFSRNGKDTIEFLISTNPGETKRPLAKVVSGGELSRIMLAVKTLMADKEDTPTQIFDEIDVGISGRTAQKVSEKMARIGQQRQVICITHLPQIAAMADTHFEIQKNVFENVTITNIKKLSDEESTQEIARILGGAEITRRTLDTALEMKDLARVHKNTRVKK